MSLAANCFTAYVTDHPGFTLHEKELILAPLKPEEVRIKVTHCGVCRSDLHFMHNSWGDAVYPMVPGHEIVGTIAEVGSAVNSLQIGQRVGVSWQTGACGACRWCDNNHEEFCAKIDGIGIGHLGGFASHIQVSKNYIYLIPDSLSSAEAAPLFCAGATAYNAIKSTQVHAGKRVAVLGVGGIGHLVVQFAKACGAEVIALINDLSCADEIKKMGASEVYLSDDLAVIALLKESCDVVISTLDNDLDYKPFIDMLMPLGMLCFIGIPPDELNFSIFQLVIGHKKIMAVPLGSRRHIEEVLEFAALHQIKPLVELMPMSSINEALKAVEEGKARYRFVMTNNEKE